MKIKMRNIAEWTNFSEFLSHAERFKRHKAIYEENENKTKKNRHTHILQKMITKKVFKKYVKFSTYSNWSGRKQQQQELCTILVLFLIKYIN